MILKLYIQQWIRKCFFIFLIDRSTCRMGLNRIIFMYIVRIGKVKLCGMIRHSILETLYELVHTFNDFTTPLPV